MLTDIADNGLQSEEWNYGMGGDNQPGDDL
jgi:hypothetical protein